MSGIFGAGIIPGAPQPGAYTALVAFFGGDSAAADSWLAALIAYSGTGATAAQILLAFTALGPPSVGLAVLRALPVLLANDWSQSSTQPTSGLEVAVYTAAPAAALVVVSDWLIAVAVPARDNQLVTVLTTPPAGAIALASDY